MTHFIVGVIGVCLGYAVHALMRAAKDEDAAMLLDELNIYDKEETYDNCTVQVLTNTVTGKTSIGWRRNERGEDNEL